MYERDERYLKTNCSQRILIILLFLILLFIQYVLTIWQIV